MLEVKQFQHGRVRPRLNGATVATVLTVRVGQFRQAVPLALRQVFVVLGYLTIDVLYLSSSWRELETSHQVEASWPEPLLIGEERLHY